ncbi:MAG: spore coat protein [Eubacterium sp.]
MGVYSEKEILADALTAQKSATEHFNTFSNECVHDSVRNVMLHILGQEHEIQKNVFDIMHTKGYYPTPAAEEKKIQEAKQKYCQCVK